MVDTPPPCHSNVTPLSPVVYIVTQATLHSPPVAVTGPVHRHPAGYTITNTPPAPLLPARICHPLDSATVVGLFRRSPRMLAHPPLPVRGKIRGAYPALTSLPATATTLPTTVTTLPATATSLPATVHLFLLPSSPLPTSQPHRQLIRSSGRDAG